MYPPVDIHEHRMTADDREEVMAVLADDELYQEFVYQTQGAGLWKRRTLPNILPSSIDISRLQPPSSTPAHPAKPSASPPRGQSPPHPGASRQGRKNSAVWRRTSSRASIFSTSPERPGSSVTATPRQAFSAFSSTRPTRKFMYSLAAVTMHTRHHSSSLDKKGLIRRESTMGFSRMLSMTGAPRRGSSAEKNKISSFANLVGMKQRAHVIVKEAKSKTMWRKLRLWSRIISVLCKMLEKHAISAMSDPSSPFYSHSRGIDDIINNAIDKDHYMFFDPSDFKANRQRRMSQEVKRILTKPPEERTPEEIHFAMIGLRDIPQLAIFPVRMQRNLAQFGEFQCYEPKRMVLKQGHRAEGYYFVLYGNVVVAVKNEETGFAKIVVELPRGEAFGELAIVSGGNRNSSVLTKTYTELLCISKSVYETIFMTGGMKSINDPDQNEFLSSLPFLRGWPLQKMSDKSSGKHVRFMYIQRNGVIMRDSNCNDWLIVVKSGSVTVLKKLVRSKPTVSRRSGLFTDSSCSSGFQTFLTDSKEYARWLHTHSITLPPPLQLHPESDEEEEEVEEEETEEEEVEEVEEEEVEYDEEDSEHNDRTEAETEEEAGEEEEEEDPHEAEREAEEYYERKLRVQKKVRPQTCVEGAHSVALKPRKAWSAKHPAPSQRPSILSKRTRLKRPKIHFEEEPKRKDSAQGGPLEEKFVSAKRTLLDDLDAAYLSRTRILTEADKKPQFVNVHTLTKGDVFGLAALVFPDQPSLCLVSNGAECMFIDKRFYMENCPPELSRRLKTEVSPYPSEKKLQQDLVNRINWDVYKDVVKRQVYQQCPTHVTVTPL